MSDNFFDRRRMYCVTLFAKLNVECVLLFAKLYVECGFFIC